MVITQKTYQLFLGACGVLMLCWAIAYGIATYRSDQCNRRVEEGNRSLRAQLDALDVDIKATNERLRAKK